MAAKRSQHLEYPDFTEEAVNTAMSMYLTLVTYPVHRYSIVPISKPDERRRGYDVHIKDKIGNFKPFYMQFKRPYSYKHSSDGKINRDRRQHKLETEPRSLFFGLQPKKEGHDDFQHNVLFELCQELEATKEGDAAYVCPLFLNQQIYSDRLHQAGLMAHLHYGDGRYYGLQRQVDINGANSSYHLVNVPILQEHICIRPHARVTHARHKYSFTERGDQVCFHSPMVVKPQPNFAGWLIEMMQSLHSAPVGLKKRNRFSPSCMKS